MIDRASNIFKGRGWGKRASTSAPGADTEAVAPLQDAAAAGDAHEQVGDTAGGNTGGAADLSMGSSEVLETSVHDPLATSDKVGDFNSTRRSHIDFHYTLLNDNILDDDLKEKIIDETTGTEKELL